MGIALAYFGIKKAYVEEWAFIVIALPGTDSNLESNKALKNDDSCWPFPKQARRSNLDPGILS